MAEVRASSGNILCIIDARAAGVSGDKYLGALLELGGKIDTLEKVAQIVKGNLPGTTEVKVRSTQVERGEIGARLVTVSSKEDVGKRSASVLREGASRCARRLGLSQWGKDFVSSTIETLARAESIVHNQRLAAVELHELGSADTLVDVLGVAALIQELGLEKCTWISTSIAVGSGVSHFSGKDYPNPPPAVLEILARYRFPIRTGAVEGELTTPTGAAITVNLASEAVDSYPAVRPERVGYGAGSRELGEVANVVRIIVGNPAGSNAGHEHDEVVVLETNLDDVTGEVIGRAMERVMEAGARDVTVTPVFMKKNRPGYMISVIADAKKAETLAGLIMAETGTLGVRQVPVNRHISLRTERRVVFNIKGRDHPLTIKVALDRHGRVLGEKPEYESLRRISVDTGLTVKRLEEMAKQFLAGSR